MVENKYDKLKREKEKEKMRQELIIKYSEEWKPCKQVIPPTNDIPEYLGELDADLEWSHDAEGAYKKFLNIEAYKRFIEIGNLILMGRTGTGKSSILHRYAFAINSGEISDFSMAICINFEKIFKVLKQYEFGEEYDNGIYIDNILKLILKLYIIYNLVRFWEEKNIFQYNIEFEVLSNYVRRKSITRYTNIIDKISSEMDIFNPPGTDLRTVAISIEKAYRDIEEEKINDALDKIMGSYKILILADSVDYYDITEKKEVIINKALVELIFQYYRDFSTTNILLKAAIPSEIYTHIIEQIAAKRKTKVIAIEWRYKDLIKMIALKIFYYFNKQQYEYMEDIISNYTLEDMYDYGNAINFLHTILPQKCRACIPVDFETLPYCIRHTQKKPRQIVTVFNYLVDKILREEEGDFFIKHSDEISTYVHQAQKEIINDALNMYNVIAKEKVLQIVKSVLDGKRNILDLSELNSAVKDALNIIGSVGLSENDVKQILIESGMIGRLYEEHYVLEDSTEFNNYKVLKICIALFEYQIKDTLPMVKGGKYVLHPMCYEYYTNEIDYNTLIYPSSADDIDDNVITKLEKEGVIY